MQKKILTLAAPLAIAALALSACGGSSTPAASSSSQSSATSAAPTSAAPTSSASTPAATESSESADGFGSSDSKIDTIAKGFAKKELPGATIYPSAKAKEALGQAASAQSAIAAAKIEPASCKAAITKSLDNAKVPADLSMAMVIDVSKTQASVSFMEDPSKSYFQTTIASADANVEACKSYTMEMGEGAAGVKASVETVGFDPEGVTGDAVSGMMTKTTAKVGGVESVSTTTQIVVVRGDRAIQVSKTGTSGDDRAAAAELAKSAQDYWASN